MAMRICCALFTAGLLLWPIRAISEPAVGKPGTGPAPVDRKEPEITPVDDPAVKLHRELCEARDRGDLLRAAFEAKHRPGPPADGATEEFETIVKAYRAAIDLSPRDEIATYCRQRLAGAYTYTGNMEGGLRVLMEAMNVAATPVERIAACQSVGLHLLQAMHKPAEAVKYFERAQSILAKIEEGPLRVKWATALDEGIDACRKELAK